MTCHFHRLPTNRFGFATALFGHFSLLSRTLLSATFQTQRGKFKSGGETGLDATVRWFGVASENITCETESQQIFLAGNNALQHTPERLFTFH